MVRVIREKSLSQKLTGLFHNFKLVAFMGVMTLVVGLTFYLTTQQQDNRQRASGIESVEYGFNTHINATGGTGYWENLTPENFNKTVDDLIANKQQWIRVSITPWELLTWASPDTITWNEPILQKYTDALSYAKSNGLKVYIATALPDYADQYTKEQYLNSNIQYHTKLANSFKDKVDIWQIYNEPDIRTFKGYKPLTLDELNSTYLEEFVSNFRAVKNTIKAINPNVKFTANASGFPISSDETNTRMNRFFDAVAPEIDIIALDLYPLNTSEIAMMKSTVIGFGSKYSKPVIIAETGFPTGDGRYTEQDQGAYLSSTVEQLKLGLPIAILIYQYSDTLPTTDTTEASFGVVKADGTKKTSYQQIMTALSNTGLLRVETNPAVGATIAVTSIATNQVVLTKEWGVDWEKLPIGEYKVKFTNPNNLKIYDKEVVLPQDTNVTIKANETTTLTANLTNGTINGVSNPTTVPPTAVPATATPIPTNTPTPTKFPNSPTPSPKATGLLRVTTSPATAATIKILKTNGSVVMTSTWSIDWKPLTQGTYYIQFSYPRSIGLTTPRTTQFNHYSNKVTEIIGNFKTGRTSISYK